MLFPKKIKYQKIQRGRLKGKACCNNKVTFGQYGLQSLEAAWITSNQIETIRKLINRNIKKIGKLWIKIFPFKPITKRSAESRMGSGKGNVEFWVAVVKPQTILFEISGISKDIAKKIFSLVSYKLPIKTKFLINTNYVIL